MIDDLRTAFRAEKCHHVTVPGVLAHTDTLRADAERATFATFDVPDRGHYEIATDLVIPPLFDELRGLAEQVVERSLQIARASWQRLRHRDFMLLKGDGKDRLAEAHVELTLDFSAAVTGGAEMIYTDGYESWPVAQTPGSVTVVHREPWLFRYDRYLTHAVGDKVVHRLRLLLT